MNKKDLKNLALKGICGGLLFTAPGLIAAQNTEADEAMQSFLAKNSPESEFGSYLAGGSCGGGSCGHRNSAVSMSENPAGNNAPMYQSGCGGQNRPQSGWSDQNRAQSGCGGQNRPQSGCGGQNRTPNYYDADKDMDDMQGQNRMDSMNRVKTEANRNNPLSMSDQPTRDMDNNDNWPESNTNRSSAQTDRERQLKRSQNREGYLAAGDHATAKKLMTDSELMMQLDAQGKATFQSLTPEGKALALKLANHDCKGKNDCKGLNSCKTADNSCAGKGGCKGTSPGPFKDKNMAVKVASMKMAEKRNNVLNKSNGHY